MAVSIAVDGLKVVLGAAIEAAKARRTLKAELDKLKTLIPQLDAIGSSFAKEEHNEKYRVILLILQDKLNMARLTLSEVSHMSQSDGCCGCLFTSKASSYVTRVQCHHQELLEQISIINGANINNVAASTQETANNTLNMLHIMSQQATNSPTAVQATLLKQLQLCALLATNYVFFICMPEDNELRKHFYEEMKKGLVAMNLPSATKSIVEIKQTASFQDEILYSLGASQAEIYRISYYANKIDMFFVMVDVKKLEDPHWDGLMLGTVDWSSEMLKYILIMSQSLDKLGADRKYIVNTVMEAMSGTIEGINMSNRDARITNGTFWTSIRLIGKAFSENRAIKISV